MDQRHRAVHLLRGLTVATVVISLPAIALTCISIVYLFTDSFIELTGLIGTYFALLFFVGIPLELLAACLAAYCFAAGKLNAKGLKLVGVGHMLCLLGFIVQLLLVAFPKTGWELLFLPHAFSVGQLVAAVGVLLSVRSAAVTGE